MFNNETVLLTRPHLLRLPTLPGFDRLQPVLQHCPAALVNETSVDVTLGDTLLVEVPQPGVPEDEAYVVKLEDRSSGLTFEPFTFSAKQPSFVLLPGQFVLASTQQIFNMPEWLSAEYKLKSSMARRGLEHLTAGWIAAGFSGSALTLELKNVSQYHAIELTAGVRIGQVVFWAHKTLEKDQTYQRYGRYGAQGADPIGA